MKTIIATIASITLAAPTFAADIGDNLIRSNVPSANGSVPGFLVLGEGYFVEAAYADKAIVDATVLPAGLNSKDLDAVMAYLADLDVSASPRLAKDDNESERVETVSIVDGEEVVTVETIRTTSRAVNGGW